MKPFVLVTFLVTDDGEQGHPMDTIATRVDVAADGTPDRASLDKVMDRIEREVRRKARPTGKATEADDAV